MHKLVSGNYAVGRHLLREIDLHAIDLKFGIDDNWSPRADLSMKKCWSWMQNKQVDVPSRLSWSGVYPGIYVLWFGRFSPFTQIYRRRVAIRDFQYRSRDALGVEYGVTDSELDTSVLEQQIELVRDLSSDLWETESLFRSAVEI